MPVLLQAAAAVRFAAVTALATLVGGGLAPADVLATAANALPLRAAAAAAAAAVQSASSAACAVPATCTLLPLLAQCLDEEWYADVRLSAAYVVQELCKQVGGLMRHQQAARSVEQPTPASLTLCLLSHHPYWHVTYCTALRVLQVGPRLSDDAKRAVYTDLLKRLDDSSNKVCQHAQAANNTFSNTYCRCCMPQQRTPARPTVRHPACTASPQPLCRCALQLVARCVNLQHMPALATAPQMLATWQPAWCFTWMTVTDWWQRRHARCVLGG
jgi:hypothetical protein